MTTSKELNEALSKNVRCVGEEEYYPFTELVREECDIDLGELGVLEWTDSFRDPDEPGVWVFLFEHEGLDYAVYGAYDSWNGVDIYDYDIHPVRAEQKVVTRYVDRSES